MQFVLHPSFKSYRPENGIETPENDASEDLENRRPPTAESSDRAAEREWIDVKSQSNYASAIYRH